MRRAGGLFDHVIDRDTLRAAFARAARGKRSRPCVRDFAARLDERCAEIARGVAAGSFPLGRFRQFVVHDPKRRVITAPEFSERVLHHAIMLVCEPFFERWLVADTFACRPGKGREAAVRRAARFSRGHQWCLHLDVRKCFDSIAHDILLGQLARRFKDRRLLGLFDAVVRSFRGAIGTGLPIGSLCSQHLANFHLGWLDRQIKEGLRVRGYVRYMDDLVLWGDNRETLVRHDETLRGWLAANLRLDFKPATPRRSSDGLDFLGCRVFSTHVGLARRSRVRWRRKVARIRRLERLGGISERAAQRQLEAATTFAAAADARSWRYRTAVLQRSPVDDR
jgi:hypothetical protein